MLSIAAELGVDTLQRTRSERRRPLDTILVGLLVLVVIGMVLRFGHGNVGDGDSLELGLCGLADCGISMHSHCG